MRLPKRLALLGAMLTLSGCRSHYIPPEQPMPPNTVLLSQMMRELSAQPGFTQDLLKQLEGAKDGRRGPALLTPALIDELRKRILGKDWQGLDRFPGWTMREINPTVRLADRLVGKNSKLEGMSAVHPGAPAQPLDDAASAHLHRPRPVPARISLQTISLDQPSTLPGFTTQGLITSLGMGVTRGDGPNALAPEHAESQRLADVLNRLSLNKLDNAQPVTATIAGHQATTPEDLMSALTATGHSVTVTDSRYFANFGHLHYKGMDVMMPFWVDTEIAVPHTGGLFHRPRPLLVPVSHAEYEWHIRGPRINADISHYFGIDGKAEWRTMDTLDQAWVLKRDAHTYTGAQAIEVTRLVGLITLAYMHQHAAASHASLRRLLHTGCLSGRRLCDRSQDDRPLHTLPKHSGQRPLRRPTRRGNQRTLRCNPQGPRRCKATAPSASSALLPTDARRRRHLQRHHDPRSRSRSASHLCSLAGRFTRANTYSSLLRRPHYIRRRRNRRAHRCWHARKQAQTTRAKLDTSFDLVQRKQCTPCSNVTGG